MHDLLAAMQAVLLFLSLLVLDVLHRLVYDKRVCPLIAALPAHVLFCPVTGTGQ